MTREEAVEVLKERYLTCVGIGLDNHANRVNEAIDMAIEAMSAEAVQGEWIDYVGKDLGIEGQWLRDDGKTMFVQCDQCDSIFVRNLMTHMNFCPNCGARMRGEEE